MSIQKNKKERKITCAVGVGVGIGRCVGVGGVCVVVCGGDGVSCRRSSLLVISVVCACRVSS